MIRALLLILIFMLLATPAHAVSSVALVGDSIHEGGQLNIRTGTYGVSRHRISTTLRALLAAAPVGKTYKGATVTDWSIPSSNPSDCSLASCRSCRAPR